MDGFGAGLSVVHERLAGQKRQLEELEDKVREVAATAVRQALRTRGVESRLGVALDARVNAIVERALAQLQPDAEPIAPGEESRCYVCLGELKSGEAVMTLCGNRHQGHTIHFDCAVGMLALEGADTGDGGHAFGQQVCGVCRQRDALLQRRLDEGGYPFVPDPPDVDTPAQQALRPIAGSAPLPVAQLPEQPVMPAVVQPAAQQVVQPAAGSEATETRLRSRSPSPRTLVAAIAAEARQLAVERFAAELAESKGPEEAGAFVASLGEAAGGAMTPAGSAPLAPPLPLALHVDAPLAVPPPPASSIAPVPLAPLALPLAPPRAPPPALSIASVPPVPPAPSLVLPPAPPPALSPAPAVALPAQPVTLDLSDTGQFVAMGFEEELVRQALQDVGMEGSCAVVQHMRSFCAL